MLRHGGSEAAASELEEKKACFIAWWRKRKGQGSICIAALLHGTAALVLQIQKNHAIGSVLLQCWHHLRVMPRGTGEFAYEPLAVASEFDLFIIPSS